MNDSVFEVFRIGIGPSSSHTVGPMLAAGRFLAMLRARGAFEDVARVRVGLHGSLALTGPGHATDLAVVAGLLGERPEAVDPYAIGARVAAVEQGGRLMLGGSREIAFARAADLVLHRQESLPEHPNGMTFEAFGADGGLLVRERYFSVGGGAVLDGAEIAARRAGGEAAQTRAPCHFDTAAELLAQCREHCLDIAGVVWRNELAYRDAAATHSRLLEIWRVMRECIERGLATEGVLPGGLGVRRRAPALYRAATEGRSALSADLRAMDAVSAFAIAVNEENACGGRVVTAPTNGSAGVIPAVLYYFTHFCAGGAGEASVLRFLLTAGGIGMLYKKNASISAAEMGCQGEIGVSCSMAAAGLAAVLGASSEQIENAAEIAMEHNLGMTCDPVGGLVQVPCIERNSMGAVKAINAARLAMMDDGRHIVSLDAVIETMRQTGLDLQAKYRETSLGGLAVNVVNC